jgi:hypothetical protein
MGKRKNITSVITGDVIHSQKVDPTIWLDTLKKELNTIGSTPSTWEIYRGDSFQLEVSDPYKALNIAIKIKASLKCIKYIDVRMAIGIGDKTHSAVNITESNGSAFVFSGKKYEEIVEEKQNLAVASESMKFNKEMNLFLKLVLIAWDKWSVKSAEAVRIGLENPNKTQKELGAILGIHQNAVSGRQKRAQYDVIKELIDIYQTKLKEVI